MMTDQLAIFVQEEEEEEEREGREGKGKELQSNEGGNGEVLWCWGLIIYMIIAMAQYSRVGCIYIYICINMWVFGMLISKFSLFHNTN